MAGETGGSPETDGFAAFMSACYPRLVRSAFLLIGDRGRAEDLVQSALYRTLRSWPTLRARPAAEAYTRTTMVRLAARWGRRRWRGELPEPDPAARTARTAVPDPDTAIDTARALARISSAQRAVLVLRFFDDLTEAQTAELLRCSVGTVKSRASRGLAALRATGLLYDTAGSATGERPAARDDSEVPHG